MIAAVAADVLRIRISYAVTITYKSRVATIVTAAWLTVIHGLNSDSALAVGWPDDDLSHLGGKDTL